MPQNQLVKQLPLMTARQALEIATRGGAAVLGRTDLGSLEAGKCGDFCAINLDKLEYAGGLHDPSLRTCILCTCESGLHGGYMAK